MILLEFTVDNIWYRPRQDFESRDYLCREGRFTQHKHWAVQCTHGQATELVNLELDLFWRGHDHAGPSILIELFGYMFHAKIYDSRHWNYDKACWYLPGEQDTKD